MDKTITGIADVDGELTVARLSEAEAADDNAPVWIVEIWTEQKSIRTGQNVGKWQSAADFKKHGVIVPVPLAKAIQIAHKRQAMRPDYVYRIKNVTTKVVMMAAVL